MATYSGKFDGGRGLHPEGGAGVSLGGLADALWERRMWIAAPILIVMMVTLAWLMAATPYYRSTAKVLIESQETGFTRPDRSSADGRTLDQEMVRSQEQLLLSVDLGRNVIRRTDLASHDEFAPSVSSLVERLFASVGITRDAQSDTASDRLLDAYFERLSVYQVDSSRVIAIEFAAADPELAATVANAIADAYIEMQRAAKRDTTIQASTWLGGQIESLRSNVEAAERRVEQFRRTHGLFSTGGAEARSLSDQQLSELSSQLASLRAEKSDAQARARMISNMLGSGGSLESSDVLNSPVIQSLEGDQARLRAQLAELSTTLGPRHPRIRQANAEIVSLNQQIRAEAEKIVRSLENDARVATEREEQLLANLDTLKINSADSNEQEVELRALERDARTQRELLESMLTRFGEASVRDTIAALPADARLISRALPAQSPYFPRKLPILIAVFLTVTLLSVGLVVTLELMRQVSRAQAFPGQVPVSVARPRGDLVADFGEGNGHRHRRLEVEEMGLASIAEAIAANAGTGAAQTVLVTSVRRIEALPALAMRLARRVAAAGEEGLRVVVVDTAFGERLTDPIIGSQTRGLGELLSGKAAFETALVRDPLSRVHIVPAGVAPSDPVMLISSERMDLVLAALGQTYDAVILLAPTVNRSAEARLLARRAGFGVLVTTGYGSDQLSLRARDRLHDAGIPDVAVINVDDDREGDDEADDAQAA